MNIEYVEHFDGESSKRVALLPCHREFAREYRRLYRQMCEASGGDGPQLTDEERGQLNSYADLLANQFIYLIGA